MPKRKTEPASKPARKTAKRPPQRKSPPSGNLRPPQSPNPPPKPSPSTFRCFRPNRSPLSKGGSALPAYWTSSLATYISPPELPTSKSNATRRPYSELYAVAPVEALVRQSAPSGLLSLLWIGVQMAHPPRRLSHRKR